MIPPLGTSSRRPRLRCRNRGFFAVVLVVGFVTLAAPGLTAQEVRGRVVDAATGGGVASATVELLDAEASLPPLASVGTDGDGRFRVRAPGAGTYRIRADHIGYRAELTSPFDLVSRETLEVEVWLGAEALALEPLVIVSDRPARVDAGLLMRGFYERREQWGREGSGFGHFLDREEVRGNAVRVTDLLREVPGIRIEARGGHAPGDITMRAVTSIRDQGFRCSPLIFLDGAPAATGSPGAAGTGTHPGARIDELVSAGEIVGVEVYPGLAQPAEFTRGGTCGVIAIWTRGAAAGGGIPADGGGRDLHAELRIGSGVGHFVPTESGLHWAPAPTGSATVEWRILRHATTYLGVSRIAFGCERGTCSDRRLGFVSRGWDAGIRAQLDLAGGPWIRIGLARHRLETSDEENGEASVRTSSPGVGLDLGAGLAFDLGPRLSVTPGVRYLRFSVTRAREGVQSAALKDRVRAAVLGVGIRLK